MHYVYISVLNLLSVVHTQSHNRINSHFPSFSVLAGYLPKVTVEDSIFRFVMALLKCRKFFIM